MLTLSHDAWTAVAQHLDPVSVFQLLGACKSLHEDISSNSRLWRLLAQRRWPGLDAGGVQDYHAYMAAHRASHKMATQQPWTASVTSTLSSPPHRTAQLLLAHPCLFAASCSTGRYWQSQTCAVAAVNERLHFWCWRSADPLFPHAGLCPDPPATAPRTPALSAAAAAVIDTRHRIPILTQAESERQNIPEGEYINLTAVTFAARAVAAREAGSSCLTCRSHEAYGHTGAVTVMLQVPTGDTRHQDPSSCSLGFATGSADYTVKLWTPSFSSSSSGSSSSGSSAGSSVRPVRTLTGHTDSIKALASLEPLSSATPILASGSGDSTIRLWSLACMQQQVPATKRGSRGGQQQQHEARSPFLGTLRGHGASITSLLPWAAGSSTCGTGSSSSGGSSGSSACLLSGSSDARVKLWDVSEGRRSCAATWRLSGPCLQLLHGLDLSACVLVMLRNQLLVLDTRVPAAGSAVTQGVLSIPWGSSGLAAAAACKMAVAAGGRQGVRAWDVRMCSSGASTAGALSAGGSSSSMGRGGSRPRLLLSGALPHKAPVDHVHLDALKLVAASSRSKLHSAAGIVVWDLATGSRSELPSSCLSGIKLHPSHYADALARAARPELWQYPIGQLLDQLSDAQAQEARLIYRGLAANGGEGTEASASSEEEAEVAGAAAGVVSGDAAGSQGSPHDDDAWSLGNASDDAAQAANSGPGPVDSSSSSMSAARNCIEPGILAVAVHGPVLATIDSLGMFLLRDFTTAIPGPELLQSLREDGQGAARTGAGGGAATDAAAATQGVAAAVGGGTGTTVSDVAEQLSRSKFWRS